MTALSSFAKRSVRPQPLAKLTCIGFSYVDQIHSVNPIENQVLDGNARISSPRTTGTVFQPLGLANLTSIDQIHASSGPIDAWKVTAEFVKTMPADEAPTFKSLSAPMGGCPGSGIFQLTRSLPMGSLSRSNGSDLHPDCDPRSGALTVRIGRSNYRPVFLPSLWESKRDRRLALLQSAPDQAARG